MKFKRFALIGVIGFASMLTMGAFGGCSDLRKADVSAGVIAASLHTAATTNHMNTMETDEERKLVANFIVQAASANDEFIGILRTAESNGGKLDAATAAAAFDRLVTRVDQLNDLGILGLKNQLARETFASIIASIKANLALIRGLAPFSATSSNHVPPVKRRPAPIFAAITFTATEIEELIALALAAGSTLLPKLVGLRGKSNEEILAEAEADDAAAIAQAVADGGDAPKP